VRFVALLLTQTAHTNYGPHEFGFPFCFDDIQLVPWPAGLGVVTRPRHQRVQRRLRRDIVLEAAAALERSSEWQRTIEFFILSSVGDCWNGRHLKQDLSPQRLAITSPQFRAPRSPRKALTSLRPWECGPFGRRSVLATACTPAPLSKSTFVNHSHEIG
jgi:hypothetical protein